MVKVQLEKALWGNAQPPYISPPHHLNRITVEVFYDQPIYTSGSEFRCYIEMHRPALYPSVSLCTNPLSLSCFSLDFCTFQFVGVCTALQLNSSPLLQLFNVPRDSWELERTFFYNELEKNSREAFPNITHPIHTSFQRLHSPDQAMSDLPSICYSPFSNSNRVTFLKSFPHLIFEKETFSTNVSSLLSTTDGAVHTYGFECLIPPGIPPSFSGKYLSYSYFISIVLSRDRSKPQETYHILLPVPICVPEQHSKSYDFGAKFILDPDFFSLHKAPALFRLQNNSTINSFSFRPQSWKGGTSLSQLKYLPPLSRDGFLSHTCNVLKQQKNQTSVPHSLETFYALDFMFSSQETSPFTSSLKNLNNSHSKLPHCGDQIRIFCKSDLIAEIQFMSSYNKCLLQTNTRRDSQVQVKDRPNHDSPCVLECFSNDFLFIHFDFSKATRSSLEIHLYLISEEALQEEPFFLKNSSPLPAHRKIIWQEKHVVLHHTHLNVSLKILPLWTSTFSTPLVRLNYILFFHFFCSEKSDPKKQCWNKDVTELFWTTGVSISDRCVIEKPHTFSVNSLIESNNPQHGSTAVAGVTSTVERLWEFSMPPNRIYHRFRV